MSKVSIVVPIYNVEKYLRECLDSLINQTLDDIEIILINNGASFAEETIINEYASTSNKIKIIKFATNQGYGKAVNTAIMQSNGEYVGILESDDFVAPEMYQNLYEKAKHYNADIIKSAYTSIDIHTNERITENFRNKIPSDKCLSLDDIATFFEFHPSVWSCLYRSEFLKKKKIKFVETKDTGWVDNPFQVEAFINCDKFVYIPDSYYYYRVGRKESSSSLKEGISIPADTTISVHKILEKYNVENPNVYKSLAIRESAYINILKRKLLISNYNKAIKSINSIFELIGTSLDEDPSYRKSKQRLYRRFLWHVAFLNSVKTIFKRIKNKKEKQ